MSQHAPEKHYQTVLYDKHIQLGATMIEFGSWIMPVQYTNIREEHLNTRNNVSMFDTCHMGEIDIAGPNALAFIQTLVPRNLAQSKNGRCYYTHLCNEEGGILDDVIIYRKSEESFTLVVNSETDPHDFKWIQEHAPSQCSVTHQSASTGKIDVQGPRSYQILSQLFNPQSLGEIPYFGFQELSYQQEHVLVSRTGYTGELGYELYASNSIISQLWDQLLTLGVQPAGLGARDTLRLEMGYPLMGSDFSASETPIEAGFSCFVEQGKEFIGKQAMLTKKNGKHRIAFVIEKGGIARHDCAIMDQSMKKIGIVTSGTLTPSVGKAIGLGFVHQPLKIGDTIYIQVRSRTVEAKIAPIPFISSTSLKQNVYEEMQA